VRQGVALGEAALVGDGFVAAVNETGWKLRKLIFLGLSSANWMMRPPARC